MLPETDVVTVRPQCSSLIHASLGLLVAMVVGGHSALAQGFSAGFELSVTTGPTTSTSSGTLEYLNPITVFLDTRAPEAQQMWLEGTRMTLYYPQRQVVMKSKGNPEERSIMFDSLAMGIQQLDQSNFEHARLVIRTRTADGKLKQRWQLEDKDGKKVGLLMVLEGPEGLESLEMLDENEKKQRRYHFGPRQRVAGQMVPSSIEAEYFAESTDVCVRKEGWVFTHIAPLPEPDTRRVGREPKYPDTITPQELPW